MPPPPTPSVVPGLSDEGLTALFVVAVLLAVTAYDFYQIGRGSGATVSHVVEAWGRQVWWLKWAVGAFLAWLWCHWFWGA